MGVVIDHRDAADLSADVPPPPYPSESGKTADDCVDVDASRPEKGDGSDRVAHHVDTRTGKLHAPFSQRTDQAETRSLGTGLDVDGTPRRLLACSISNRSCPPPERATPRIIDTAEHLPRHRPYDTLECRLDLGQRPEMVEVVGFDVGHDEALEAHMLERAERLVDLQDQQIVGSRTRIRAQVPDLSAHDERRIEARRDRRHDQHRRRGGLSVRTCRPDRRNLRGESGEQRRTIPHRDGTLACGSQLCIGRRDSRGRHEQIDAIETIRSMTRPCLDSLAGEFLQERRRPSVGTGHRVAATRQQPGERGHSRSTHADDVNPIRL
jgi:hypothetical protein